jgi:hypothetical protein
MVGVIQLEWGQVQNKKQINYKQWELTSIRLFNLIWQYHLSLYVCVRVCVKKLTNHIVSFHLVPYSVKIIC